MSSLAVTLFLLEILFRLVAPESPPGTTYGKPVIRNAFRLRDRDFSIPKPEDVYRIVTLGDSFTWGVGLDIEQTLPKILERELNRSTSGVDIEVVNAAEPGFNTVEELLFLRETGVRYQPDIVLLIYNLNDIEFLPELAEGTYQAEHTPVVEIDPGEDVTKYSRNAGIRGWILEAERHSVFIRFLVPRVGVLLRKLGLITSVEFSWVEKIYQGFDDGNPGWLESKRALTEIAELCRVDGCDFLVAVFPLFVELEDYKGREAHEKILEFCSQRNIAAVDLLPAFENTRTRSHWINFMDAHPNAAAHRAAAERILPVIRERIPGEFQRPATPDRAEPQP